MPSFFASVIVNPRSPSIIIALCGNKSDLAARRQVTQEEAKKYAEEEGLMWGETSAKSGEGVTEIFTDIGSSPWTLILISLLNMLRHSQEAPQECAAICPRSWRVASCNAPIVVAASKAADRSLFRM